jgi:hypothetical protein
MDHFSGGSGDSVARFIGKIKDKSKKIKVILKLSSWVRQGVS